MKTLAIIGSGVLGIQVAHYAINDHHYKNVVFIDDFSAEKEVAGIPIIGKVSDVIKLYKEKLFDEILLCIGYNHLDKKKELFEKLRGIIPFGQIIHSTSWIDRTVKLGQGIIIYPGCSIDFEATLEDNLVVTNSCTIAHNSVIGAHCFLSPRVAIAGFVSVGEKCIIGINATIIDNITIISKTQVGGGTVVVKNIEKSGLYVGNPQRFIR